MSTFLKLDAVANFQTRGLVKTVWISFTFQLNDQLTVEMPIPFVPIGGGLAVTPTVTNDGDSALRIDLTRWSPAYVGIDVVAVFPGSFTSQSIAVKVAREFDADPTTSWSDPASIRDWLRTRYGTDTVGGAR